jgi:hypothetical protein
MAHCWVLVQFDLLFRLYGGLRLGRRDGPTGGLRLFTDGDLEVRVFIDPGYSCKVTASARHRSSWWFRERAVNLESFAL